MATVYPRRDGPGWIYSTGSRKHQRRVQFDTEEEAYAALKIEAGTGTRVDWEKTIDHALEAFLAHMVGRRQKSTIRRRARQLRTFRVFLLQAYPGLKKVRDLKPQHVEDFQSARLKGHVHEAVSVDVLARHEALRHDLERRKKERQEGINRPGAPTPKDRGWLGRKSLQKKVTPRTINNEVEAVQVWLGFCERRDWVLTNVATRVDRLRELRQEKPRAVEAEDLKKLFSIVPPRLVPLWLFFLGSGCRTGEVIHLQWRDIDFDRGILTIHAKPEAGWEPKTGVERVMPLQLVLLRTLAAHRELPSTDPVWVFTNRNRHRYTQRNLFETLRRLCRRAGIQSASLHAFRHSTATLLHEAGVGTRDIQAALGHADIKSSLRYTASNVEHLRGQVERLSPLLVDLLAQNPAFQGAEKGVEPIKH